MKEIIYVAGAGRSGTTLLDIILGNISGHFSLGELNFFVQNGIIENHFCSCGEQVHNCEFWSKVISSWESRRILPVKEYRRLQLKYFRNKTTLRALKNYVFPSRAYLNYLEDTRALYEILFSISEQQFLVDSSKNAQFILLLRKLKIPFKVVHIKRSFKGVLNSTRKTLRPDRAQGVEKQIAEKRFRYSFAVWFIDNFLVNCFAPRNARVSIQYEDLIELPKQEIAKISKLSSTEEVLFENRGPFEANHLVAGGRVRMNDKIHIRAQSDLIDTATLNTFERLVTQLSTKLF